MPRKQRTHEGRGQTLVSGWQRFTQGDTCEVEQYIWDEDVPYYEDMLAAGHRMVVGVEPGCGPPAVFVEIWLGDRIAHREFDVKSAGREDADLISAALRKEPWLEG